jgi:type VI protein secretion system component VasK
VNLLSGALAWVGALIGLAFTIVGAYFLARWSWRWFLFLVAVLACGLFLWITYTYYPPERFLDPELPSLFFRGFWIWVLVFVLGIITSIVYLARTLRAARPSARTDTTTTELAGRYPEIDAAWEEITIRLGQARIDLASQHVYLLLAPDEDWTAAVIHSAGLQLFAHAPDGPSPIHAFATAEGVLLGASGASAFGTQDGEGVHRMEYLCRLIAAHQPDCPVVRGVVVLFPISWVGQRDSVKMAAALRDDLNAIRRTLKVRLPVFALIPEMETVPGFNEFIGRMSQAFLQRRSGFAVPSTHVFSGELVQRGFVWMSDWYHGWILNLISEDLLNQAGNYQLFRLDHEIRRFRKRLRAIMEAAFSTHRESEPILFRGCYFLASGNEPHEQAFAAGLFRGPRGRIYTEHGVTQWTEDAERDDRQYRRIALGIGLAGGVLTLLVWAYILSVTDSSWWAAGLIAVVIAWAIALFRIGRL